MHQAKTKSHISCFDCITNGSTDKPVSYPWPYPSCKMPSYLPQYHVATEEAAFTSQPRWYLCPTGYIFRRVSQRRMGWKPCDACFCNYSPMASVSICLSASLSIPFEPDGDITDQTARGRGCGEGKGRKGVNSERMREENREVIMDT